MDTQLRLNHQFQSLNSEITRLHGRKQQHFFDDFREFLSIAQRRYGICLEGNALSVASELELDRLGYDALRQDLEADKISFPFDIGSFRFSFYFSADERREAKKLVDQMIVEYATMSGQFQAMGQRISEEIGLEEIAESNPLTGDASAHLFVPVMYQKKRNIQCVYFKVSQMGKGGVSLEPQILTRETGFPTLETAIRQSKRWMGPMRRMEASGTEEYPVSFTVLPVLLEKYVCFLAERELVR